MAQELSNLLLPSLVVGAFVGFASGYIGSIMVSKRMALVGDALSHVALPGLALGLLLNFNPFIGAFAFLALTAVITWYVQRSSALPAEAVIGVLFVLALAVGILITPQVDLLEALFGNVSAVTPIDAVVTAIVSAVVIVAVRATYSGLALSMVSRELAISKGVKVERINLIYLLLVVAVVAVGIKEVGTLLVGAVVIVPAAAARNVSSTLSGYALLSASIGVACALIGVVLSSYVNVPAGPLVVVIGSLVFALTFVIRQVSTERI